MSAEVGLRAERIESQESQGYWPQPQSCLARRRPVQSVLTQLRPNRRPTPRWGATAVSLPVGILTTEKRAPDTETDHSSYCNPLAACV